MDCIFCKIADKKISAEIISEDNDFIAFKDIHPKAPIHFLIIPKSHVGAVSDLEEKDRDLVGNLILKAKDIAEKMAISENGYRLIFNVGRDAGMEIDHLHLHLLAGKSLEFSA